MEFGTVDKVWLLSEQHWFLSAVKNLAHPRFEPRTPWSTAGLVYLISLFADGVETRRRFLSAAIVVDTLNGDQQCL